ncbi:MAG: hypothetical protein HY775_08160 [Acidobacteria bacterium]|nr:hypothetical protein [Acidobacteriota bacterium]
MAQAAGPQDREAGTQRAPARLATLRVQDVRLTADDRGGLRLEILLDGGQLDDARHPAMNGHRSASPQDSLSLSLSAART